MSKTAVRKTGDESRIRTRFSGISRSIKNGFIKSVLRRSTMHYLSEIFVSRSQELFWLHPSTDKTCSNHELKRKNDGSSDAGRKNTCDAQWSDRGASIVGLNLATGFPKKRSGLLLRSSFIDSRKLDRDCIPAAWSSTAFERTLAEVFSQIQPRRITCETR